MIRRIELLFYTSDYQILALKKSSQLTRDNILMARGCSCIPEKRDGQDGLLSLFLFNDKEVALLYFSDDPSSVFDSLP